MIAGEENLKPNRKGRPKGAKNRRGPASATLEHLRPIATKIIIDAMNSTNPDDRRWAVDKFSKYIFRQLPQDVDITSKGNAVTGMTVTVIDSK